MIETLKQIFHRMSIVFSNQLAILITIPYITFILGVDGYGIVAAGIILVQICWILCDWGFGFHSIEFFSKNQSLILRNEYCYELFRDPLSTMDYCATWYVCKNDSNNVMLFCHQ